jgi:hypothetical protein
MVKVSVITFGTSLCIGINAAICDFAGDGMALVFYKVKAIFTFIARVFPMVSLAIINHKFLRNRRAAFSRVVQEVPRETQVTCQVIQV